jgi:PAS domain S-box-containing protein
LAKNRKAGSTLSTRSAEITTSDKYPETGILPGCHPEKTGEILPDMYQSSFLYAPVSLWIEDFSEVKHQIDQIKRKSGYDLRTVFKRHPEEIIALAQKVIIIEVNEATLHLYKAETKDELCQGLSQIFNKESYDVFREELIALADGKTVFRSEAVNKTLDGEEIRMLMNVTVPPGFEQTLSRVLVSINDVTEMKIAEAELMESEEKYRKIFESSCNAIFIADPETGILLGANSMAEQLVGIPSEKIIGMHYTELHPLEKREDYRWLFQKHVGQEGFISEDILVRHRSGRQIPVAVSSSMMNVGDRRYIIGVFRKTTANETMPTEPPVESVIGGPVPVKGEQLTRRECEVLRQIAAGYTNKQVAQRLNISPRTVETHRTRLMKKLNCHNAAQLINHAVASHILD